MVKDLSYGTINNVMENWEAVKRLKDCETSAGLKLFQRLFDKCPDAKLLFGFPIDLDVDSSDLLQSKRFQAQAAYFWSMIDTSLNMLGPDTEMLTEIMEELGKKHVIYGVKPEMFPIMGEALIWTLKDKLSDAFTDEHEESWRETYDTLSSDMIRAMMQKRNN